MNTDDQSQLAEAFAQGIAKAHKQESPINPQNIFYALGVGAVAFVGYSFSTSVEANGAKIDELTEAVGKLVLVSENQQSELGKRGVWMEGIDTYSEQSRLFDQKHDQEIGDLKRRVASLEGER